VPHQEIDASSSSEVSSGGNRQVVFVLVSGHVKGIRDMVVLALPSKP
jgi:hypothetical protein